MVWTNKTLGEDGPDKEIQTPYGALTLANDRLLEIDWAESSIHEIPHKERDTDPVKTAEVQRVDQTEATLNFPLPPSSFPGSV
jgi:hypothetical protein